jgi:lysozyme family protein
MTKAFLDAFKAVIGYEGGYADDPNDRGGETKYGISKRSYPNRDIAALTLEDAKAIYYVDFWHQLRLDDVTDYQIALELFDTAVNCGVNTAVIIAQKALNFLGGKLAVDGAIGSRTVDALNVWSEHDPEALHKALNGYQFMHYERIVTKNPSQMKFARGWLKRIQSYRKG